MLHRLALDLGMTVRRLSLELDGQELTEWQAFYEVRALLDKEASRGNSGAAALKKVEAILEMTKH